MHRQQNKLFLRDIGGDKMVDEHFSIIEYKITIETFNDFFGAWLKRNLFARHRLKITALFAVALLVIAVVTGWRTFQLMIIEPNLPLWLKISELVVFLSAEAVFAFLVVAIPVYILSPIVSYLWLVLMFIIGPVRKRVNTAEISEQGITKTYEMHGHTTPWSAVYDLVETKKSLLIFTNRNCAMMIPKRAFSAPEAADAFFIAACTFWKRAKA